MGKNSNILYIFDIKNNQNQYAKCLKFITTLLDKNNETSNDQKLDLIRELAEEISIFGSFMPNYAKNYYEQPIIINDITGEPIVKMAKKVEGKNIKPTILNNDLSVPSIHIRVHLEGMNTQQSNILLGFQYLALLIQRLEDIFLGILSTHNEKDALKKISVFIVPSSGNYYPFENESNPFSTEAYDIASHFMRLLSKEYAGIIYGATLDKQEVRVKSLDFKMTQRFKDYLPLIPLDKTTYYKLFDESISSTDLNDLLALKGNKRFRQADDYNPNKAFRDYVIETAYHQFTHNFDENEKQNKSNIINCVLKELLKLIKEKEICLISLAVFFFTFNYDVDNSCTNSEAIHLDTQKHLEFSEGLSDGLRQISQNTLQHSQSHKGVLSFYLKRVANDLYLDIVLSDFNNCQTFINNFICNLEQELKYSDNLKTSKKYQTLINNKSLISLGDFFGEYTCNEIKDAWSEFRTADSYAHIGLLLFSLVLQQCKGYISLINSIDYVLNDNNIFVQSYDEGRDKPSIKIDLDEYIIPGTQLCVSIPICQAEILRPIGLGQLNFNYKIQENYKSFAKFLDYTERELNISTNVVDKIFEDEFINKNNSLNNTAAMNVSSKYRMISDWKRCLLSLFSVYNGNEESRNIFYIDLSKINVEYINSPDYAEIFIKGLFMAIDTICENKSELFAALINTSAEFFQIFRQITISLSSKSFPDGLQLYVCTKFYEESIHLVGNNFSQAISNAYTLALEHGSQSYSLSEMNRSAALFKKTTTKFSDALNNESQNEVFVCPFDTILPNLDGKLKIFDARIIKLAENPIDQTPYGYKFENIHMRLGSKVHIRAFYEMAFLFYRTGIANRIAFEILKSIQSCSDTEKIEEIDLKKDNILFYGYASYSKALLTSLLEILKEYRFMNITKKLSVQPDEKHSKKIIKEISQHLAISSYQHNLQSEFQAEEVELYFNFYGSEFGEILIDGKVKFNCPVKLVQVVPISSTLTTFDKMEHCMKNKIEVSNTNNQIQGRQRFTVFWVTDSQAESEKVPCKDTEEKYWESVELPNRVIIPKTVESLSPIKYFMRCRVIWDNPLGCDLCFPDDVIGEIPLVETDQTSTVPSQQLHGNWSSARSQIGHTDNDNRLLKLKSCVYYGHFQRGKNHFQFYLETQKYFNKVSKDVQDWLEGLSKSRKPSNSDVLNIIFSPEHVTNVGFAQYVNNYYFKGNAEIVCINEDKSFRSNFKCEHMALRKTIEDLLVNSLFSGHEVPISFYFVDDTIISGETFYKANNFLHSLIPSQYQQLFPVNLIKKCFLLVDRLSMESKQTYVKDVENDFLSFLHIDLSNMRTHGDSCVVCKLNNNADRLLKRSASRKTAFFWSQKEKLYNVERYNNTIVLPFGKTADDRAFRKLVLSHITYNFLFKYRPFFQVGDIYDSILIILNEILVENKKPNKLGNFEFDVLLSEIKKGGVLTAMNNFLKILSRPFFSFDFKVKLQVLTLIIIFCEYLLDGDISLRKRLNDQNDLQNSLYKKFLYEDSRIEKTLQIFASIEEKYLHTLKDKIDFVKNCLLDCLVEMHSTYMLRKSTLKKMFNFLLEKNDTTVSEYTEAEQFWEEYLSGVHYILNCNGDETRSLWLEYLLISGMECRDITDNCDKETFTPCLLYSTITGDDTGRYASFYHFCNEFFLQNNRILIDSIENVMKKGVSENSHIMDCRKKFDSLDRFEIQDSQTGIILEEEKTLYNELLAVTRNDSSKYKVKEKYDKLLSRIVALGEKKYGFKNTDIALITTLINDVNNPNTDTPEISQLDFVSSQLNSTFDLSFNKYEIKQRLIKELSEQNVNNDDIPPLKKYGYVVSKKYSDKNAYFFVFFEDPKYPIVPVYLYFSFGINDEVQFEHINLMLFLRDTLSFRNMLLLNLEKDFAGDSLSKYAHTSGEKSILAHEKATSHNTTGDDSAILDALMNKQSINKYSTLNPDQAMQWLLLHNYNNAQIAKLFNRNYQTHDEYDNGSNYPISKPLYLKNVERERLKFLSHFEHPLKSFLDLRWQEDRRFALLESVVKFDQFKVLMEAEFIMNDQEEYYNVEYFKNILIDIIISSMKYSTASATYLERIDEYLTVENYLRHIEMLNPEKRKSVLDRICKITFSIEHTSDEEPFNYLVIKNKVNKLSHNLFDWKKHNQIITARLENPMDCADGHMSMLAISRYIEGLWPAKLNKKAKFGYIQCDNDDELFFETKLPILRKDG